MIASSAACPDQPEQCRHSDLSQQQYGPSSCFGKVTVQASVNSEDMQCYEEPGPSEKIKLCFHPVTEV